MHSFFVAARKIIDKHCKRNNSDNNLYLNSNNDDDDENNNKHLSVNYRPSISRTATVWLFL